MALDDQFTRYFGTSDPATSNPPAPDAGIDHMRIVFGSEKNGHRRFGLWRLLYMLGHAPGLDVALPLALLATAAIVPPAQAATPIAGRYVTADGAGIVQIAPCGSATCGRLVQILKAKPGAPRLDVNNRDPALRNRPIQGIAILSGFADRGADWRGTIYDPRNGKSYKSIVSKNADGSLNVQGCIVFFCQTQRWTAER